MRTFPAPCYFMPGSTVATWRACGLPGANFEQAVLHSAHLTGSQIPSGRFRGANLCNAGLAEIEWERADLRNVDFREATFHLGSSRSGLVGSPLRQQGESHRLLHGRL